MIWHRLYQLQVVIVTLPKIKIISGEKALNFSENYVKSILLTPLDMSNHTAIYRKKYDIFWHESHDIDIDDTVLKRWVM